MDESIIISCQKGELDLITTCLKEGLDLNTIYFEDQSLLQVACAYGHFNIVDTLIENGANINFKNKFGWSALMQATRSGHSSIILKLLPFYKNNIHIENSNEFHIDLLCLAMASNSTDTFEIILEFYKTHYKFEYIESNALIYASLFNNKHYLKMLLKKNLIDINHVDPLTGHTALMTAAFQNNLKIVKILIKHNADVNLINKIKLNALDMAIMNDNKELINYLRPLTEKKFISPESDHFSWNASTSPLCHSCKKNSPQIAAHYLTPKSSRLYPSSNDLINSPYLIIKNPIYRNNLNSSSLIENTNLESTNTISSCNSLIYSPKIKRISKLSRNSPKNRNSPLLRGRRNWKTRCRNMIIRFQNYFFKKNSITTRDLEQRHFIEVIKSLSLEKFLTIFLAHEIDYDVFITMTKENLEEIGITNLKDQLLILNKIKLTNGQCSLGKRWCF